ncbi:MAG: helix-turn-helix transcriptional regulator [Clostridia bacterium]|jgi:transcriptional regulator with XRE-family HTH domain|nr:helix-turn-helix transcriptional regulator [Clostridia bacterium]
MNINLRREEALHRQSRNLKRIRADLGLTQREIAERLQITVTTYQRWEHGKTMLRLRHIAKIISTLHVTPNDLFGISD